ncbi:hypothetical protein [Methylophilus sp. TWE2]|uniref:hypothetical protein n=1 Tax=Methylophilus sp. TWE2 TaxID=1662285 RepID=UPI00067096AB|nr:hypothetical protein [Methylophilus sp. TWE2]AKR42052.1 hypothetical protein ACJ67_00355 [Methylophilus sp. TWE2]
MRKSLANVCKQFSNKHTLVGEDRITRATISDIQKYMERNARNVKKTTKLHIQEIATDIDLQIICLTSLAITCLESWQEQKKRRKIVMEDFPANDMNLGGCLLNIANTAMAINKLCLEGLDTQARVLVRTLDERLMQTPILFASKEDYKEWHKAESPEDSKSAHYRVFARKKRLYKRHAELESICLGTEVSSELHAWKQENEDFYSMAVHGASSAVQIGSWAFDFGSEGMRPNLFGTASAASIGTLKHTRFQLFWFMILFPAVLEKFHTWKPDVKDHWQKMYMVSKECIFGSAHEWLVPKNNLYFLPEICTKRY